MTTRAFATSERSAISDGSPYTVTTISSDPATHLLETTFTAEAATVNIGNGLIANVETFNGEIPGPTLLLQVNDTVVVRLVNHLTVATSIHWHGIELENSSDGTPFTQNIVPPQYTYLYKFKVTRPGIFWYHPHHHSSTNQVFKGLYGMIVVADTHEAALQGTVLPSAAQTLPIVLSDTTVCKTAGTNDTRAYSVGLPWVNNPNGGTTPNIPAQASPTPLDSCEGNPVATPPTHPIDENGSPRSAFTAGDIPNIQTQATFGQENEGQTVLTNGVNVGARAGSPSSPGALSASAVTYPVVPGQGLRLELLNAAAIRFFRLRLTDNSGNLIPLYQVGGEGGLLNQAVEQGGVVGTFDTRYTLGEILLPPGSRADVVVAIPTSASGVLTLWTEDFPRTGLGFSNIATVPVMHLQVSGAAVPQLSMFANKPILTAAGGSVPVLGAATGTLQNPASFTPAKLGLSSQNIQLTKVTLNQLGVDSVFGTHDVTGDYSLAAHLGSTRYAKVGDILALSVQNTTGSDHPFHLHGFSMQPISLTKSASPTYTWPYTEFRDNIDIPAGYTLNFKIKLDDRPLEDGSTPGGALGRWLFHCHIFFHATNGMLGELVVLPALSPPTGNEKPTVNVGGSWAYAAGGATGGLATRDGTYNDIDGDPVTLSVSPSIGTLTKTGTSNGTWHWSYDTTGVAPITQYVYVTATAGGLKDQTVWRLKIGGADDGADNGDPHLVTVNGKHWDFQSAGEFTLLRNDDGLEIQARQTPVTTATPVTDPYTGLTSCVSVNTAVAAQLGTHRVAVEPVPGENRAALRFYLDGRSIKLSTAGNVLGPGARVALYNVASGVTAFELDSSDGTSVIVEPWYWAANDIWLLDVNILRSTAKLGVMGSIPSGSWLPPLPDGRTLGPKPASLSARYVALNQVFANAWRVSDTTSLFTYAPGTSTATFTDTAWPPEKGSCTALAGFAGPNAHPSGVNINPKLALRYCEAVKIPDLRRDCLFDVVTTGDPTIAKSYLQAQLLQLRGTLIRVSGGTRGLTALGKPARFRVAVAAMIPRGVIPTGNIRLLIDGTVAAQAVALDKTGTMFVTIPKLAAGAHKISANYTPAAGTGFLPSSSPTILYTVLGRGA